MEEKGLTIREAKNEIKRLENQLNIVATKKNINLLKVQPRAMQIKDIVVDSSHMNIDTFLNYTIRDEETDNEIYEILVEIYSYKAFIAKEIQRMAKYDEIAYIRYLKYDEKKSWYEIDEMLHHGIGYSKLKYNRYKKSCK